MIDSHPDSRPMGFTGSPLDRADPLRTDAQALAAARADPRARFLLLQDLDPLMQQGGRDLCWLRLGEVPEGNWVFLGLTPDGAPRFAVDAMVPDGLPGEVVNARMAGAGLGDGRAEIVAQARSLLDWHRRHGFCPNCGTPTMPDKGGYSRRCGSCGTEHFPRVDPVVIMLPEYDGRILVGRSPRFQPGFYSAFAGFVEPGESLEEAVARELWEEAGVKVGNVHFGASQPWPFPCSLMIGAFADADSDDFSIDGKEIEAARWVTRQEAGAALQGNAEWNAPSPLAIANWLIASWVARG